MPNCDCGIDFQNSQGCSSRRRRRGIVLSEESVVRCKVCMSTFKYELNLRVKTEKFSKLQSSHNCLPTAMILRSSYKLRTWLSSFWSCPKTLSHWGISKSTQRLWWQLHVGTSGMPEEFCILARWLQSNSLWGAHERGVGGLNLVSTSLFLQVPTSNIKFLGVFLLTIRSRKLWIGESSVYLRVSEPSSEFSLWFFSSASCCKFHTVAQFSNCSPSFRALWWP